MASGTVVTTRAKKKMLLARAGEKALPKIIGMAFGDGGVNSSGAVIPHSADSNALHHEVLRKAVDGHEIISADDLTGVTCQWAKLVYEDDEGGNGPIWITRPGTPCPCLT